MGNIGPTIVLTTEDWKTVPILWKIGIIIGTVFGIGSGIFFIVDVIRMILYG